MQFSHLFFMIVVHTRQADLKSSEAATMLTPEVSSPATTIDVTSDDEHTDICDNSRPHKRTHGGRRNTKRYGDKLLALEPDNIRYFLANKRCYCGKNYLLKLHYKGREGQRVVYDLRAERFERKTTTTHTKHRSMQIAFHPRGAD